MLLLVLLKINYYVTRSHERKENESQFVVFEGVMSGDLNLRNTAIRFLKRTFHSDIPYR